MSEEKNMAEVKTAAKAAENRKKSGWPRPCVWCGPSVKGVAAQYTVFTEMPEALEALVEQHPAARGLVVALDKFPQVRRKLEECGTKESAWYNEVKHSLNG